MYNLYLLNYKNYYNRQVKRLPNLQDYLIDDYLLYTLNNVNFKPDNWVNTTQVINCECNPNYLIAEDLETGEWTRWFVIESDRIRNGQYKLSLLRDIICDELANVLTSKTYIEKGYVKNTDPLILNEENFNCNQIKTKEIQLYDKTGIPWLFIYFSKIDETSYVTLPRLSDYIETQDYITGSTIQEALGKININLSNYFNKNIVFEGPINEQTIIINYSEFINVLNNYEGYYFRYSETSESVSTKIYKICFEKFWDTENNFREIYRLYIEEVTDLFNKLQYLKIPASTDAFVMTFPFSDLVMDTNYFINITKTIQLQKGSNVIFDAQILPYNPYISKNGVVRYTQISSQFESTDNYNSSTYFNTYQSLSNESIMENKLYGSSNKLSPELFKRKEFEITINNYFSNINGMRFNDNKLQNQLLKHRLCSPNYNGVFEFNYSKFLKENEEFITFTVDIDYKPYNPYIHISPKFDGMYGKDFNDARGLVCSGDFSVTQASDAWANYQLQNKNYENQFNRQIENMETNNRFNVLNQAVGSAGGVASGVLSGAVVGSIVPGIGTVAGAISGGVASAVGGVADIIMNQLQYSETLDYTKDMYNYNLQNIKAIPYTLTKVSSYNSNNKNVPFVELYCCTNQEYKAFKDKIYYNGMTVNVIGELMNYIYMDIVNYYTYVKGKMIYQDDTKDYYYSRILANEVNQGFFIQANDLKDLFN